MALFTFAEVREACGGTFSPSVDPEAVIDIVSTDSRKAQENMLFFALEGERFDAHDFLEDAVRNGAVLLCVSAKKANKIPFGASALLVEDTLKAYQALAAYHRNRFPALKVIALTGSSGKTSSKEILRSIFQHVYGKDHVLATEGNTNNQIGVPQNLLKLNEDHQVAIIEMGTNHHGEIEPLARIALPEAALIVSIGSCHLEFLKDLNGVATEKSHIFVPETVKTAVFPAGCGGQSIIEQTAAHVSEKVRFSDAPGAELQMIYHGGNIDGSSFELIDHRSGDRVRVQWNLPGRHQAMNAAGAAGIALASGLTLEQIAEGIRTVNLPGLRMKKTEHGGALWLNDAYNANPDSMCAALGWLAEFADPAHLVLALGDMAEIGKDSMRSHIRVLTYAYETFPGARIAAVGFRMTEALTAMSMVVPKKITAFPSAGEAVEGVRNMVREGDLVFLKGSRSTGLEILEPQE